MQLTMASEQPRLRINLGAGSDIIPGWINHDLFALPGIDQSHNLNIYPWPWSDSSIDEVVALDVLEHLDDFVRAMEELYRILKPGGMIQLKGPYWNSAYCYIDPTHRRGYHESSFLFFDPRSHWCTDRSYYTHARFLVEERVFHLHPFAPYFTFPFVRPFKVKSRGWFKTIGFLGNFFSNIILDLEVSLIKPAPIDEGNRTDI